MIYTYFIDISLLLQDFSTNQISVEKNWRNRTNCWWAKQSAFKYIAPLLAVYRPGLHVVSTHTRRIYVPGM